MEASKCCHADSVKTKGFWRGLVSGLIPHSFCLLFIGLSIIGATGASALIKNILLIPNIFQILIILSVLFATVSAGLYLKKTKQLCLAGVKTKWRYLLMLFSTTIITNAILLLVVFPAMAKLQNQTTEIIEKNHTVSLTVDIPCSGHAPLIIEELKKENGVGAIAFEFPSTFKVAYNPELTSPEKIRALKIFQTFNLLTN
jgi:hypothetical protein